MSHKGMNMLICIYALVKHSHNYTVIYKHLQGWLYIVLLVKIHSVVIYHYTADPTGSGVHSRSSPVCLSVDS